jgi:hypothetical protein
VHFLLRLNILTIYYIYTSAIIDHDIVESGRVAHANRGILAAGDFWQGKAGRSYVLRFTFFRRHRTTAVS